MLMLFFSLLKRQWKLLALVRNVSFAEG